MAILKKKDQLFLMIAIVAIMATLKKKWILGIAIAAIMAIL